MRTSSNFTGSLCATFNSLVSSTLSIHCFAVFLTSDMQYGNSCFMQHGRHTSLASPVSSLAWPDIVALLKVKPAYPRLKTFKSLGKLKMIDSQLQWRMK